MVEQFASHVDLFPTIVEAVGAALSEADTDLPGVSLWPAITGRETSRDVFAEYHAMGSRISGFAIRHENFKLIYHVDMPSQLFDLGADPFEENDLSSNGADHPKSDELESRLRQMLDPEAVDSRSKAHQAAHMENSVGSILSARREYSLVHLFPAPKSSWNTSEASGFVGWRKLAGDSPNENQFD